MDNPLFVMRNNHYESCGVPPSIIDDKTGKYYGYFQNEYGEQWIFTDDPDTGIAELRGGDIGWDDVQRVKNGRVDDLVLGRSELMWLQACWKAAVPR